MKIIVPLALAVIMLLSGCNNNTDFPEASSAEISQCDAVRIARTQVPPRIAEATPAVGFRHELGLHGTWFVTFVNVDATFDELGWKGDAGDYFDKGGKNAVLQDKPEGVYANVTIYVDAQTGEVTKREINNGMVTGGPSMFLDCD